MNRSALALSLAVGLSVSASVLARQAPSRTVYVSFVDQEGAPVSGLTARDVTVVEDGRIRQVLRVEPASDPMTIAIVVDDQGLGLTEVREGLAEFVASLPATASIGLFSTVRPEWTMVEFTRDRQALQAGIQRLVPVQAAASTFEDLTRHLLTGFERQHTTRPIILLVASGSAPRYAADRAVNSLTGCRPLQDSRDARRLDCAPEYVFNTNWDLLVKQVARTGTTFYAVGPRGHGVSMDTSAEVSGGRIETTLSNAGIEPALRAIAAEMLGQYAVTYAGPAVSKNGARLLVTVSRPGVFVRARERVY